MARHGRTDSNVCVIVPTYNRAQYLGEAIESVLAQSVPPHEIIVLDDGSTDNTPEVARSFGDTIRYIRTANAGKPAAVNLALSQTQCEYVIIADDDDIMEPHALAHLLAPLERDPSLDFANGGISYFRDYLDRGRIEAAFPPIVIAQTGHHFETLLMGYSMTHNATLIRHRCYQALGGIDESFSRAEDYDFMLRLTCQFRGVSVPERVIRVRLHDGARGDARTRHSASERQLVHFDFGTRAFELVRRDAPIAAYIGRPGQTLSEVERFEAWFKRSAAMARHGVWQGFREDIRECGRCYRALARPQMTEDMANTLSMVFSRADTIEARLRDPEFPGWVIKEFVHAFGKHATRPIARGFYWAARDAYTGGARSLAIRCLGFAVAMVVSRFLVSAHAREPKTYSL